MSKPAKLQKPYTLELSFDVDQLTESLQYKFYDTDGNRCDLLPSGPLAGTFNFKEGDEIIVRVVAHAEASPKEKSVKPIHVNITNCTIISIKPAVKQDLSLFDPFSASIVITEWSLPKLQDSTDLKKTTVEIEALKPLRVTANSGQWKISGYLSALIGRGKGTDPEAQLYYFDPESSASGGAGFGHL